MSGSNQPLSLNAPENSLDKIFYRPSVASIAVSESASPLAPTIVTATVDNPEGQTFFISMQVSLDQSTWYDSGLEPNYLTSAPKAVGLYKRFAGYWYMTATTITYSFFSNDGANTIYYRVVGYSKE